MASHGYSTVTYPIERCEKCGVLINHGVTTTGAEMAGAEFRDRLDRRVIHAIECGSTWCGFDGIDEMLDDLELQKIG